MKQFLHNPSWQQVFIWLALGFCALMSVLAFYWDYEPKVMDVKAGVEKIYPDVPIPVGGYSAVSLHDVLEALVTKRGGFISNDVFFPGVWMDNLPNWELGALSHVRLFTDMLHDHWSLQKGDEDMDVATANSRLILKHTAWQFPSAESEYLSAAQSIGFYAKRLVSEQDTAKFNANKQNLEYWLAQVEYQLDASIAHLNAAPLLRERKQQREEQESGSADSKNQNVATSNPQAGEVEHNAKQSVAIYSANQQRTSWLDIDDYFYQARGSAWALVHFFEAIKQDYAVLFADPVLNAQLQLILEALYESQQTLWSPMILNGDGMGVLANHSLVMSSYLTRAKVAIHKLRGELK